VLADQFVEFAGKGHGAYPPIVLRVAVAGRTICANRNSLDSSPSERGRKRFRATSNPQSKSFNTHR
jgi:hypothetical protein